MLAEFLNFVLEVFKMMVELFQYTNLGGFSFETVLVSILLLSLIIRTLIVKLRS